MDWKFQGKYEAILEFTEGWEGVEENPFHREVHEWIFSATNSSIDHFAKPYLNQLSVR